MADITVTKNPNTYELAAGKIIVSLYDLDESSNIRMVLRVKDFNDNTIGDLRQIPNAAGYAHFDIGRLLKSKVSSNPSLETITQLSDGTYEIIQYYYEYGYAPFDGDFVSSGFSPILYVLNGRKYHDVIDWDSEEYLPKLSLQTIGGTTFNRVDGYQKALTDRVFVETTGVNVSNKPSWLGNTEPVSICDIRRGNDYTLSFINGWIPNPNVGNWTNGINAVRIAIYGDTGLLLDTKIDNIVNNGGGPSLVYGDEAENTDQFRLLTVAAGISNALIDNYPEATHYYIATATFFEDPDIGEGLSEISHTYRFNIVDGECNDFDNIQVSWLNSLGGRDYFDFQKRSDKQVNVERNTYRQLDANWASTEIVTNPYNRGETVFSQKVSTSYTANTRYLTDEESNFLENLYISPDVRVKIGDGDWVSVVLTSNQFTERTYRKDSLFQHTITFNLANNIQTQNG